MNFHYASFIASFGNAAQLPPPEKPEVIFAGRSNVGKSTLINKLLFRKNLAKVSSTPGKTSTINFYEVDGTHLVDLPGYGYANVPKAERMRWSELVSGYFCQQRCHALTIALVDIRHDPTDLDRQMIEFLHAQELPFMIALTKADKLSKQRAIKQITSIRKSLDLVSGTNILATGAVAGIGIDELRALISHTVKAYQSNPD